MAISDTESEASHLQNCSVDWSEDDPDENSTNTSCCSSTCTQQVANLSFSPRLPRKALSVLTVNTCSDPDLPETSDAVAAIRETISSLSQERREHVARIFRIMARRPPRSEMRQCCIAIIKSEIEDERNTAAQLQREELERWRVLSRAEIMARIPAVEETVSSLPKERRDQLIGVVRLLARRPPGSETRDSCIEILEREIAAHGEIELQRGALEELERLNGLSKEEIMAQIPNLFPTQVKKY